MPLAYLLESFELLAWELAATTCVLEGIGVCCDEGEAVGKIGDVGGLEN